MVSRIKQFFVASFRNSTRRRRGLSALIVFVVLAAGLAAFTQTQPAAATASTEAEALPVESLRLKAMASLETRTRYNGTVEAARSSQLAFEVPGRVVRVLVEEGQAVAPGQVLAQLDTAELEAQRKQALSQLAQMEAVNRELVAGPRVEAIASTRAQVREAEEQLRLARMQESRREDLLRREAISREEMDSFRTQVGALEARLTAVKERLRELEAGTRREQLDGQSAQVNLARARVEQIDVQIAKSSLRAPFAGKVSRRFLDEGAYASPGVPLLELLEAGKPEIRVGLPAEAVASLKADARYPVELAGQRFEAAVLRVLPALDGSTRVVSVLLDVPAEARGVALPGMLAQVEIARTLPEAGFRVPISALTRADRGLWACYALVEADAARGEKRFRLERRDVEILHSDGQFAFVRGLVKDGERIVASGVNRVTDGQQVLVVKES
jgi:RND family efflux transporter MFP subunit